MGTVTLDVLSDAIRSSWSAETSSAPAERTGSPAEGQCAVTACVVHDYLGGGILHTVATLPSGETVSHYLNHIDGQTVDLTAQQFPPCRRSHMWTRIGTPSPTWLCSLPPCGCIHGGSIGPPQLRNPAGTDGSADDLPGLVGCRRDSAPGAAVVPDLADALRGHTILDRWN
ncbi:YunG family protein [Nocardia grenadensis]